jgi:hypothetical protein
VVFFSSQRPEHSFSNKLVILRVRVTRNECKVWPTDVQNRVIAADAK